MCKIFIYGGCGGNGNNFMTEEECLDTCTDAQGWMETVKTTTVAGIEDATDNLDRDTEADMIAESDGKENYVTDYLYSYYYYHY